jgi:hypothetical protein
MVSVLFSHLFQSKKFHTVCFTDILLAVVTDRTLLWKIVDRKRCGEHPQQNSAHRIGKLKYSGYFELQNWTLKYDEWSKVIEIPPMKYLRNNNSSILEIPPDERVIVFPYNPLPMDDVSRLHLSHINETIWRMMFANGTDFLYGMLLQESVSFADKVLQPPVIDQSISLFDPSFLSLIVNVGESTWNEDKKACLHNIIFDDTRPCQIFVIADDSMPNYWKNSLVERCSLFSWNETFVDQNLHFLRQMHFFASSNRGSSGFVRIGPASSRANFIRERMEYIRHYEAWRLGRIPPILPDFITCPGPQ